MSQVNNPLEIFKLLPKTNCKKCDLPTCLAFSSAVIKGHKKLKDCPHLDQSIIEQFEGKIVQPLSIEEQQELLLESLKEEIKKNDFTPEVAQRLGASLDGDKLKIKVLGKDFIVDPKGNIISACHVIPWITIPLLNYILFCKGNNLTGKWVPFRELKGGITREPLYVKGCEVPLQQIANKDPYLLEDILSVFGGKPEKNKYFSNYSLVLYPLPKVPILFNYNKSEDETKINIFFDSSADDNLNAESCHMLCTGFVTMLEKITITHS